MRRPSRTRSSARRSSGAAGSAPPAAAGPLTEAAAGRLQPRTWQGLRYGPCQAGAAEVRRLFDYAGAWVPAPSAGELAWEARAEDRLVGGVLVERHAEHGFIHGPVVVDPPPGAEPLEVAAQLVAAVLEEATALGMANLFTRPSGLDRVWVRSGFVPVPEAGLPPALRGRPGSGLFVWRRPGSYAIALPEGEGFRAGARSRG